MKAGAQVTDRLMGRMLRWLTMTLAALLCVSCSGAQQAGDSGYVHTNAGGVSEWAAGKGPAIPVLKGFNTAGEQVDTGTWGRVPVVVNLWYASCPPCRSEAPVLTAAAASFPTVRFLGINTVDEAATAAAYERTFAIPYPTILDSQSALVASLQGVVPLAAFPTTLIIAADGTLAARILGEVDESTLKTLLQKVSS